MNDRRLLPVLRGCRAAALAASVIGALAPVSALAQEQGHTYFCQVAQPMVARDDSRVEIHPVTYVFKLNSPVPGLEIQYTARPGPVAVAREYHADSLGASEIVNLNAASLMGIQVRVEKRPQGTWNAEPDTSAAARAGGTPRQRFFIEEMKVDLDLTALSRMREQSPDPRANRAELARHDALVEATVECILENAKLSTPPIRKVRLNVIGWDRYRHWAETYLVKSGDRKRYRY